MSTIQEKILLSLSRRPDGPDYVSGTSEADPERGLSTLRRVFPRFVESIAGKAILDFGCGAGCQAVAMGMNGAGSVLGVDTNLRALEKASALASMKGVAGTVSFAEALEDPMKGGFDIVLSHNSMEHFGDPARILDVMKSALKPDGRLYITFGPPWYAPYGSHMHFFTKVPWVNLLFSERTVMAVRARYRDDGATRYEEVESGLNRMTVAKFERLVRESRMKVVFRDYECVKGLDFLGNVPLVRELAVNNISCVLEKM